MSGPLPRRQFTGALIAMLATRTGRPIGDSTLPPGTVETQPGSGVFVPEQPYAVLDPIAGGGYNGPAADPDADATWVYQVTVVASTRHQAEWLLDECRAAFLGRDSAGAFTTAVAPVTGMSVMDRRSDDGPGGVTEQGGLFQAAERFAFQVTPA